MNKKSYVVLVSLILIVVAAVTLNLILRKRRTLSGKTGRPSLSALYKEAGELERKEAYKEARAAYRTILDRSQDEAFTQNAQNALMTLNMKILFSPLITEESVAYTVKKGDTLSGIAKAFSTTVELLMKSNNLQSDLIRVGKTLKVSTARYSVLVDRSQNILALRSEEGVVKTYEVATGINNSTPVGTFKIINKLRDPVWYKTGAVVPSGSPENILGSRWMGMSAAGYGIHGTTQPETIGRQITAGCIRLREPDVQELYAILPVGTEVTIVE